MPVYLQDALGVPVVPQGLSSHAVGVVQLDFHLIEASLHLLLDPDGVVPAPDLSVQCALHGLHDSNVVSLQLVDLLILLSNLPVNLRLDLVQLQLDAQDLSFLVLQRCLKDERGDISRRMALCSVLGRLNYPPHVYPSLYYHKHFDMRHYSVAIEVCGVHCCWYYVCPSL